jgi:acetyl esterase/lipase
MKMHHRDRGRALATRLAAMAAACVLLSGCSGALFGALNVGSRPDDAPTEPSVLFDPAHGLSLDVHRPASADGSAALVVFFYGGSWQNGSRARYAFAGRALAARGVVAVVPDYRLYPAVRFPEFMHDAARAVAWAHANARALGADPARVHVMGHSAGAQIAALLATDPRYLAAEGLAPSDLAGVIGISGPYDVRPEGYPDLEDLFGPPESWPQARPVNFVDAGDPPFLLLHGGDDGTVWPIHSERMAATLREAGIPVRLHLYPGMGHIRPLLALRYPRLAPVLADTLDFIDGTEQSAMARRQPGSER